jgi:VWFA-related protein
MEATMKPLVRVATVILLTAGLAVGGLEAQEARFGGTVEVNTVNVDVMVTRGGEPVTTLTRDDFIVLEDGQPRPITNFARVTEGVVHTPDSKSPVPDASDVRYRRHVALVFDLNFTERPYLARAVDAAKRYVTDRGGEDVDWSVAAVGASAEILLPFTSDVAKVAEALDVVAGRPTYRALHSIDESLFADPLRAAVTTNEMPANFLLESGTDPQALAQFAAREQAFRSLQPYLILARGLTDIFRAYATVEGKKACLLVTGRMVFNPSPSHVATGTIQGWPPSTRHGFDPIEASALDRVNEIWQAVVRMGNAAGFRIYAANAMGLGDSMLYHDASSRWAGTARPSDSTADWDSLPRSLADGTGGRYFTANTVKPALEGVDREMKTYYSLAFQAPHTHDNRYHTITVKLKPRGLKARYRGGYFDFEPEAVLAEQLATPASFPKAGGNLPLAVAVSTHEKGGELELTATAVTPIKRLTLVPSNGGYAGDVDVWLAIYGADGEVRSVTRKEQHFEVPSGALDAALKQPFRYTMRFTLPEGRYTVAMAIVDRNGGATGLANASVSP